MKSIFLAMYYFCLVVPAIAQINGILNEETFPGTTVAARVNSAETSCGTVYSNTCIILVPTNAPSGIGWNIPTTNNILIVDQRNVNGAGLLNNNLPNLKCNTCYQYYVGANDASESAPFSGKNILAVSTEVNGGTTTGSNASVQSLYAGIDRATTSSRQVWAANFQVNYRLDPMHPNTATGLEIDTGNVDSTNDDTGLTAYGLRIINAGRRTGIGMQINASSGSPTPDEYEIDQVLNNYNIYGTKYQSTDTSRVADIYIVPPADNATAEVLGRNSSDSATTWSVGSTGDAAFQSLSAQGITSTIGGISVSSSVISSTGLQHVRGNVGCTTGSSVGAKCTSSGLPLATAFVNTNYTLTCSLEAPTGVPTVVAISKGTTTFTITIAALTPVSATALYDCIAMHD
jgi:hypothetical protein